MYVYNLQRKFIKKINKGLVEHLTLICDLGDDAWLSVFWRCMRVSSLIRLSLVDEEFWAGQENVYGPVQNPPPFDINKIIKWGSMWNKLECFKCLYFICTQTCTQINKGARSTVPDLSWPLCFLLRDESLPCLCLFPGLALRRLPVLIKSISKNLR